MNYDLFFYREVGVFFSVVGNLIYFLVQKQNFLVFARFLTGIGYSIDGAIFGYAGRIKGPRYDKKFQNKRNKIIF